MHPQWDGLNREEKTQVRGTWMKCNRLGMNYWNLGYTSILLYRSMYVAVCM